MREFGMRVAPALRLAAMLASLAGTSLPAQVIRGVLLDDKLEKPVDGAHVVLRDATGAVRAAAITDTAGLFILQAPEPGSYTLFARRVGYLPDTSPPIELRAGQVLEMDFLIAVRPAVLPTVSVRERRLRDQRAHHVAGMDLRALGARLIPPEKIRPALTRARNVGELIRGQNIPGLWVEEDELGRLCVRLVRGRVSMPAGTPQRTRVVNGETPEQTQRGEIRNTDGARASCMAVYLDDVPLTNLEDVDPITVERMILLLPDEAGALFGTGSSQGVLLVYTRTGYP